MNHQERMEAELKREVPRYYATCKWGHSLDDALIYQQVRYCRQCKHQRSQYDYYIMKCKKAKVEPSTNWRNWMRDLTGGPFKRKSIRIQHARK